MKDSSGDKHDWNSLPKYIKKWRKEKKQGGSPFGLVCGTVREKWNVQTMKTAAHACIILPLHWEILCYFIVCYVQRIPQQGSLAPVLFLLKFPWELKAKASGDSGLLKWEYMLALKKKKMDNLSIEVNYPWCDMPFFCNPKGLCVSKNGTNHSLLRGPGQARASKTKGLSFVFLRPLSLNFYFVESQQRKNIIDWNPRVKPSENYSGCPWLGLCFSDAFEPWGPSW